MAYSSIVKPSVYFNTKLYSGNGGTNALTGVGFKPDFVYLKCRTDTYNPTLFDSIRGPTKRLFTHSTAVEGTVSNSLTSFDSDGFTLGADGGVNDGSQTFVSWNFKAATYGATYYSKVEGGTQSNSDTASAIGITAGSNSSNTWRVAVNRDSGFSIVKYVGTGANATVGHGLGVVPKIIIVKNYAATEPWWVYSSVLGATKQLRLNETQAEGTDGNVIWNSTEPTSSVFSVGTNGGSNGSGNNTIAYCFAEKTGYSKFGSYAGNNNADGTFVYTGFSPAFIIIKKYSDTGGWQLRDNKRTVYGNETLNLNYANSSSVEQTTDGFDFLSNGFKWRNQASDCNGNGNYIYMAFAQNPLVANSGTDGVPTTAR